MSYYKKSNRSKTPFIILLAFIGVISCHFKTGTTESILTGMPPSHEIFSYNDSLSIDLSKLDSIRVIYTDDETVQRNMPSEEWKDLNTLLYTARYDTVLNDSGIMVAMIAQDYALILSYKDQPAEANEWFLIWRTNERIKYRNKWYFVDTELKEELCDKLESWK